MLKNKIQGPRPLTVYQISETLLNRRICIFSFNENGRVEYLPKIIY